MPAVWTGRELLIWGGHAAPGSPIYQIDGGRYDPATDTWRPLAGSSVITEWNIPVHAAWTGADMLVWYALTDDVAGGGAGELYSPDDDSWRPIKENNAPIDRHLVTWTGTWIWAADQSRLLVWGGLTQSVPGLGDPLTTGASYDPRRDVWEELPVPEDLGGRGTHSAVWTGSAMIVWGGWDDETAIGTGGSLIFD